jgi:hypothetical protein
MITDPTSKFCIVANGLKLMGMSGKGGTFVPTFIKVGQLVQVIPDRVEP